MTVSRCALAAAFTDRHLERAPQTARRSATRLEPATLRRTQALCEKRVPGVRAPFNGSASGPASKWTARGAASMRSISIVPDFGQVRAGRLRRFDHRAFTTRTKRALFRVWIDIS
jgi:hypothetical protein